MILSEKTFRSRDGQLFQFRSPEESDVPALLDYVLLTDRETEFLVRDERSIAQYSPQKEREFVRRVQTSETEGCLLCVQNGRVLGSASYRAGSLPKTRHRARSALALASEIWGQGIGSALLGEWIAYARQDPRIRQMEVSFVEGNARARGLYEKMGFRITGVLPDGVRLSDGSFRNLYEMVLSFPRSDL